MVYNGVVIKGFKSGDTEKLFRRLKPKKPPRDVHRAALRKLLMLDAAESLNDLSAVPGNRLEKLKGKRAGQYSLRINDKWRICFRWQKGDAIDVEICDYH